jgi:hypothetical protein
MQPSSKSPPRREASKRFATRIEGNDGSIGFEGGYLKQ